MTQDPTSAALLQTSKSMNDVQRSLQAYGLETLPVEIISLNGPVTEVRKMSNSDIRVRAAMQVSSYFIAGDFGKGADRFVSEQLPPNTLKISVGYARGTQDYFPPCFNKK